MPNLAKVLKDEIARISRKEAKCAVAPIKKPAGKLRSDIAELKKTVAELGKEVKRLNLVVINLASTQPAPIEVAEEGRTRILGKGVKSLRRKLGLSQAEFGKLTGVTVGAVLSWEKKSGVLKLRQAPRAAILALKGMGKRKARAKLDKMVVKKVREGSKIVQRKAMKLMKRAKR